MYQNVPFPVQMLQKSGPQSSVGRENPSPETNPFVSPHSGILGRPVFGLRSCSAFVALSVNICSRGDASLGDSFSRRLTYSICTRDKAIELATDESRTRHVAERAAGERFTGLAERSVMT